MDNQGRGPGTVADKVRYFSGDDGITTPSSTQTGQASQEQGQGNTNGGKQASKVNKRSVTTRSAVSETLGGHQGKQDVAAGNSDSDQEYPCDSCNQVGIDQLIQCERCEKWLCCKCQRIPKAMVTAIQKWKRLHWYCLECEDAATASTKIPPTPSSDLGEAQPDMQLRVISEIAQNTASIIMDKIEAKLESIAEVSSSRIKKSYSQAVAGMSSITGIVNRASSGTQPTNANDVSAPSPTTVLETVDEYVEREKRKCNLIIHNLPELQEASYAECIKHDQNHFNTILKDEIKVTGVKVNRSIRLGRRQGDKPRLLLVSIHDYDQKKLILRNAKILRESMIWGNIYISPDLTPKEREAGRVLRSELKERKTQGETNLAIRRGKIVTLKPRDEPREISRPTPSAPPPPRMPQPTPLGR